MTAAPLMLSGATAMRPFATKRMLSTLMNCEEAEDRAIVLIQLNGGNDGLNTIIPIEQYSMYEILRPDIKIAPSDYIELDGTLSSPDQVGLNPGMTAIKNMYDNGLVNVIQGVSYPNQNRSHFKSRDLYWTGGDGTTDVTDTGWMGRYLDAAYPGTAGNPTTVLPDPLGIQLGDSKPSLGFASENFNELSVNLYGQDPSGYYSLVNSVGGEPLAGVPSSEYGDELNYIMGIENSVEVYAQRITNVFNAGSNSVSYPSTNLSNQLKTIARLMSGGCKTKIYLASIGGFDTHANQVVSGNTATGKHTNLWTTISEAVEAFTADLNGLGLANRALTVTFSEFGRKAVQNGNFGTDHGTLSCMFLFGNDVNPGVTGTNVDLSNLQQGTQLQNMQYDYRQVFGTLLQDWLGASDALVGAAFGGPVSKIPIIGSGSIINPVCYGGVALPVELTLFEARVIDNEEVELDWRTALEIDAEEFIVQRSGDGRDFETIGKVEAQGEPSSYEFTDENPLSGISYYRLKQTETNGRFTYSDIRQVEIESKEIKFIRLSPNPATNTSYVGFTGHSEMPARIKVVSLQGMVHRTETVFVSQGYNRFPLDVSRLSAGYYIVLLESENGKVIAQEKLMKQ